MLKDNASMWTSAPKISTASAATLFVRIFLEGESSFMMMVFVHLFRGLYCSSVFLNSVRCFCDSPLMRYNGAGRCVSLCGSCLPGACGAGGCQCPKEYVGDG